MLIANLTQVESCLSLIDGAAILSVPDFQPVFQTIWGYADPGTKICETPYIERKGRKPG